MSSFCLLSTTPNDYKVLNPIPIFFPKGRLSPFSLTRDEIKVTKLPMRNMRLTTSNTGVVSWRMTDSSDLRNVGSSSVAALRLLTRVGENSRNKMFRHVWSCLVSSQSCLSSHQQSFVSFVRPGGSD